MKCPGENLALWAYCAEDKWCIILIYQYNRKEGEHGIAHG